MLNQTLSGIWNEVLVIENVKIFNVVEGHKFLERYPKIFFFLCDVEKKKFDLIGIGTMHVRIKPVENEVKNKPNKNIVAQLLNMEGETRKIYNDFINQFPPYLRWIKFTKNASLTAEVLLSAELIKLSVPTITIKEREKNDQIPPEIYPEIRKFHLEVTFAGIRNARSLSHFTAGRYKIELSIGEVVLSSNFSNKVYKRNTNFMDPHVSAYLLLPEHFQFWPPIIIKHLDCSYKKSQVIGTAMIRRSERFYIDSMPKVIQRFLLNDGNEKTEVIDMNDDEGEGERVPLLGAKNLTQSNSNLKRALSRCRLPKFLQFHLSSSMRVDSIQLECEYTWWTKFYNSNRDSENRNETLHELKIYINELEKQPEFQCFKDWAYPIDLIAGKSREKYATLKTSIKILQCSGKEFFETEKSDLVPSSFR